MIDLFFCAKNSKTVKKVQFKIEIKMNCSKSVKKCSSK